MNNRSKSTTTHACFNFEVYLQHTDEKQIDAKIIRHILATLKENNISLTGNLLDIGCGNGILAENIFQQLFKENIHLNYFGIDNDEQFLIETSRKLKHFTSADNILLGDCFSNDLERLPNNAKLILAGNVAYYSNDIKMFVTNILSKLGQDSLAIFIHQDSSSVIDKLVGKYSIDSKADIASCIAQALKTTQATYIPIPYHHNIYFPPLSEDEWVLLEKNATPSTDSIVTARYLLEFIVQRSLTALAKENKLADLIADIRLLINEKNEILIPCIVQVAANTTSEQFKLAVTKLSNTIHTKVSSIYLKQTNTCHNYFSNKKSIECSNHHEKLLLNQYSKS